MTFYLFWVIVGVAGGVFCALCERIEGKRICYDRKLQIQFTSIIFGFVIGVALFAGAEPKGGLWIGGLVAQLACAELAFWLLR